MQTDIDAIPKDNATILFNDLKNYATTKDANSIGLSRFRWT